MIAAQDARGEIPDDRPLAEALGDVVHLHDHLPRALARPHREIDLPDAVTSRGALDAQVLEARDPPFVARAPRLDSFANPHLFLCEHLVEALVRRRLGLELFLLAPLVIRVAPGKARKPPAVELDH